MLQLLCDLPNLQGQKLLPRLKKHLDEGVIEQDDCWFLASMRNANPDYTIKSMQDRTGLECFINKIHVDTYEENDLPMLLGQGFLMVKGLLEILEPRGVFNIILDLSRSLDEKRPFMTANVRFHKVRQNEKWLNPDLDKNQSNALLVFTTDKQPNSGMISQDKWPEIELENEIKILH